jgi:hypothetical protein
MPVPNVLTAVTAAFSTTVDAPGTNEKATQEVFARALQTLLNNDQYLFTHGGSGGGGGGVDYVFTSLADGLAPKSGSAGIESFLRADGTWSPVLGSGGAGNIAVCTGGYGYGSFPGLRLTGAQDNWDLSSADAGGDRQIISYDRAGASSTMTVGGPAIDLLELGAKQVLLGGALLTENQFADNSLAGSIVAYNPTGWTNAFVARLACASAPATLTSIGGGGVGGTGQVKILMNTGVYPITLTHQGGGVPANWVHTGDAQDLVLGAGESCILIYDVTASYWRALRQGQSGQTLSQVLSVGNIAGDFYFAASSGAIGFSPTGPQGGSVDGATIAFTAQDAGVGNRGGGHVQLIGGAGHGSGTGGSIDLLAGSAVGAGGEPGDVNLRPGQRTDLSRGVVDCDQTRVAHVADALANTDAVNLQTLAGFRVFSSSLNGFAPASGGGTVNYLRADGSWLSPIDIDYGDQVTLASDTGSGGSLSFISRQAGAIGALLIGGGNAPASSGLAGTTIILRPGSGDGAGARGFIDCDAARLGNLAAPTLAADAVTKSYADAAVAAAIAADVALSSAAPQDVQKQTASAGTATTSARADHKHQVSTAAAGSCTPGDAAAEGTATSLARSDHKHALPAFGTTVGTFCQGNDTRVVNAVQNTRALTAGTGLTGGGDLSADRSFAVSYGTTAGTACQGNDTRVVNAVQTSRQVLAGTGLTGGGDLSADRTLTVAYGTTATTACVGNDSRLSDDRIASGLRAVQAGSNVSVANSAANAPIANRVLTASASNAASWIDRVTGRCGAAIPTSGYWRAGEIWLWTADQRRLAIRAKREGALGQVARANSTVYTESVSLVSSSSKVFVCTKSGTSSATLPGGFATATVGVRVTDGTAEFECVCAVDQSPDFASIPNTSGTPIALADSAADLVFANGPVFDCANETANRANNVDATGAIQGDIIVVRRMNAPAFSRSIVVSGGDTYAIAASTKAILWLFHNGTRFDFLNSTGAIS